MTKQHTEPLQRLETLAAENAQLKLQLKEARRALRALREDMTETVAIANATLRREQQWPKHLTVQQQLHQVGILLAQLFLEAETAPAVKEVFGDALEQLALRCQTQHPRLVQALEAQHVFPQIALALAKDSTSLVKFPARRQV